MSRVLVVDDEPAIRRLLEAILVRGGHAVVQASDSRSALAALAREPVDATILDLGLPDRDGLELIGLLREQNAGPLIVLTARGEVAEKVAALDLGADDYMTKPFDGDELLARLRSALRRGHRREPADGAISHGDLTIDAARHEVRLRGEPVPLTPREFAVLQALVAAGGRVLTHATLLEKVWGKAHLDDVGYLRVVVRALRLKLEPDPSTPKLIRNEPGIGYRLGEG